MGPGNRRQRYLIVNADDFGISLEVNQAVEQAHRSGVLTSASLMMGEHAVADALARARRLPELAVGLHVTLTNGRPVLPAEDIPDLVNDDGRLSANLVRCGIEYFFKPRVRRQLAAEIEAQFAAFAAAGLTLDHANAHNHMHLHPTVLELIISIGRRFGLKSVRIPQELPGPRLLRPWLRLMRRRLDAAEIDYNDHFFGLAATGHMDLNTVLGILKNLPEGVSEIMFHPATDSWQSVEAGAHGFQFDAELQALLDPEVRACIAERNITLFRYQQLNEIRRCVPC
jgi:hopanoid biosynthesis associated protein HpnK